MTGFKLHHPPGFVDRAYLVFLLLSQLTELPDSSGSASLSPPFHLESSDPARRPEYEPCGTLAPTTR